MMALTAVAVSVSGNSSIADTAGVAALLEVTDNLLIVHLTSARLMTARSISNVACGPNVSP